MLWEFTGNIWTLNRARTNSSMQLFTYDLTQGSQIIQFNVPGRQVVLDAAVQTPWAPPGSPNLINQ